MAINWQLFFLIGGGLVFTFVVIGMIIYLLIRNK